MKRTLTAAALAAAIMVPPAWAEEKVTIEFAYPYSHLFDVTYEKILP